MTSDDYIASFRKQIPATPLTDRQILCTRPMMAMEHLHNWRHHSLVGWREPHGGFLPWGDGVSMQVRYWLATYDSDALTRLVLAAHRFSVRVDIGPGRGFGLLRIVAHQRDSIADHLWGRHRDLDGLIVDAEMWKETT